MKESTNQAYMIIPSAPDLKGLIDDDIMDRFKDSAVPYGDIINAQLIKTNKELIKALSFYVRDEVGGRQE